MLRVLGSEIAMLSGDMYTISQMRLLLPCIAKDIDNDRRWKKIKLMILYNEKSRLRNSRYFRRFFHISTSSHMIELYYSQSRTAWPRSHDYRYRILQFVAQCMVENDSVLDAPPIPIGTIDALRAYLPSHLNQRLHYCYAVSLTREDLVRWNGCSNKNCQKIVEHKTGTIPPQIDHHQGDLMLFAEDDDSDHWYHNARLDAIEYMKSGRLMTNDSYIMTDDEVVENTGKFHLSQVEYGNIYRQSRILARVVPHLVPYSKIAVDSMYSILPKYVSGKNKSSTDENKIDCLESLITLMMTHLR